MGLWISKGERMHWGELITEKDGHMVNIPLA